MRREMRGQDLDGHGAVQPGVPGLVDLSHAAGANQRDDLVGAQACAGDEGHAGFRRGL